MMHICFNTDENFIPYLKVLIKNILDKTKEDCTFHIIGIEETDLETESRCIFYPNPDLSFFKDALVDTYEHISQAGIYRLLIPFLVKTDKALYLDIDIFVRFDLKELWDMEVEYAGAVLDYGRVYCAGNMGIEPENYYNSGVILFNSKRIREEMSDYKNLMLDVQNKYKITITDQDIFNGLFLGKVTELPTEYNMFIFYQEVFGIDNPKIVHCMGKAKYWNSNGLPYQDEWEKYR